MEIDITRLVTDPGFDPWILSNSRANLGDRAARITWENSQKLAAETKPPMLDAEGIAAMRKMAISAGMGREEIEADPDEDIQALFVQWVAGDIREAFGDDDDIDDWDWDEYREASEAGRVAGNLFRTDDGKIYFTID